MKQELLLNGVWELHDDLLAFDPDQARRVNAMSEGWIAQPVPGDIHQGLIAAGKIQEPLLGMNSYACEWTEKRSWWFRRKFEVSPEMLQSEQVELELNGLDCKAEIFLNGVQIGSHPSAFYPFVRDVLPWLRAGTNQLLVRLSAGVDGVTEQDVDGLVVRTGTEAGNGRPERGDWRRAFVRKPQYTWGWDWSPRVPTTAIAGDVRLTCLTGAVIRDAQPRVFRHGETVYLQVTVVVEKLHFYRTGQGDVSLHVSCPDGRSFDAHSGPRLLRSGLNHIELGVEIPQAVLWWPNGLGKPDLHRIGLVLETAAGYEEYPSFNYGIRFLELETAPHFALRVNGKKIFSKGADWIPTDTLYARASAGRYAALVDEARAANFNMLRVWGGGLYEPEAFYAACDRDGILLWHDFMFACTPYPDQLEWFQDQVRKEAVYQTRRLARHACIGLWSGSNENNWGFDEWWHDQARGGAWIYNQLLPEVVHQNDPGVPYWNGSPYGGDHPNSAEIGDRHHWHDGMMNADMQRRITPEIYDEVDARFISEFGYVGACGLETTLQYLDGQPAEESSPAWQHHTNTFEKLTVRAGIAKHYADPAALDLEHYLLYSGLTQGLMYGYSLDSMRANANCHGGLFWMYADCWGEVGWTIVDYYLRRKPSFYFVRRTFQPLRLVLRPAGSAAIRVIAANDLPEQQDFELEYGYIRLDGRAGDVRRERVSVPGLARVEVIKIERGDQPAEEGLWYARVVGLETQASLFRALDFRQLRKPAAEVTWSVQLTQGGALVSLSSEVYAHAVELRLPDGARPDDNFIDLLPGESRVLRVRAEGLKEADVQVRWL